MLCSKCFVLTNLVPAEKGGNYDTGDLFATVRCHRISRAFFLMCIKSVLRLVQSEWVHLF